MPKLENWKVVVGFFGKRCLFGEVYEDTRFPDGHHVLTSELVEIDSLETQAQTKSGTKYLLGKKLGEEVN
jgi:hypothetical protein